RCRCVNAASPREFGAPIPDAKGGTGSMVDPALAGFHRCGLTTGRLAAIIRTVILILILEAAPAVPPQPGRPQPAATGPQPGHPGPAAGRGPGPAGGAPLRGGHGRRAGAPRRQLGRRLLRAFSGQAGALALLRRAPVRRRPAQLAGVP